MVVPDRKRLGILAGRGELPWLAVRAALRAGEEDLRVFCITDEAPPPDLKKYAEPIVLTRFYSSTIRAMKRHQIGRLLLLGKATRDILYRNPRFDLRTVFLLARMMNQSDYSIFEYLADELRKYDIEIIPQHTYLGELFLSPGRYGKRLTKAELLDVAFGLLHAREMNRLDIGQTVVIGNRSVLAVEAAEGTDRCIRRGGELFHKRGAVVCKLSKVNHDMRFDIPTVGASTLESMRESGCRVLAFDSKRTFIVDPRLFLEQAAKSRISVMALEPVPGLENADYLRRLNARPARIS